MCFKSAVLKTVLKSSVFMAVEAAHLQQREQQMSSANRVHFNRSATPHPTAVQLNNHTTTPPHRPPHTGLPTLLTGVGQGVEVPTEDEGDGVAVVRAREGQLVLAGGFLHKLLQLPHEHHGLHHLHVTELRVPVDVRGGHQQQLPGQRLGRHGAWGENGRGKNKNEHT